MVLTSQCGDESARDHPTAINRISHRKRRVRSALAVTVDDRTRWYYHYYQPTEGCTRKKYCDVTYRVIQITLVYRQVLSKVFQSSAQPSARGSWSFRRRRRRQQANSIWTNMPDSLVKSYGTLSHTPQTQSLGLGWISAPRSFRAITRHRDSSVHFVGNWADDPVQIRQFPIFMRASGDRRNKVLSPGSFPDPGLGPPPQSQNPCETAPTSGCLEILRLGGLNATAGTFKILTVMHSTHSLHHGTSLEFRVSTHEESAC